MKKRKIKRFLVFLSLLIGMFSLTSAPLYAWTASKLNVTSTYKGKQLAKDEQRIGSGYYGEMISEEIRDESDPDYVTVRYYYYMTHRGTGSNYQTTPVALYVDGKKKETYDVRKLGRFSGGYALSGYTDVKVSRGKNHTVEIRQVGHSDDTVSEVTLKKVLSYPYPKYTVTFKDWNGATLKTQTVFRYSNATPPPNPSRTGYTFTGWSGSYTNVTSNRTITAQYKINYYTVTFKDWDGTILKTQSVPYGSNATPPPNPSRTGHTFTGWSGSYNNITGNRTIIAQYSINTYTNYIAHWAGGFENQEGTNGSKNMFHLGNSSFTATYGSSYTLDASRAITIPKGYKLSDFGTSSISGSWKGYPIGTKTVQKPYSMNYEYYYYPVTYSISYNADGGQLPSGNPTTYNILYGVTFKNPTRDGYTFMGWKNNATGKVIKGINVGANATFSSASDMYSKLNARTIGDISVTALWDKAPELNADDIVILENMYTEEEWKEERLKKATATDKEDGNITDKIKVISDNTDLTKEGTYHITYEVTDSAGYTVTKTVTVTVKNDHVAEQMVKQSVRSISADYLNTLDMNSKWKKQTVLYQKLTGTLTSPIVEERWVLTPSDIEQIKRFNDTHDYSPASNDEFMRQFSHLMR